MQNFQKLHPDHSKVWGKTQISAQEKKLEFSENYNFRAQNIFFLNFIAKMICCKNLDHSKIDF